MTFLLFLEASNERQQFLRNTGVLYGGKRSASNTLPSSLFTERIRQVDFERSGISFRLLSVYVHLNKNNMHVQIAFPSPQSKFPPLSQTELRMPPTDVASFLNQSGAVSGADSTVVTFLGVATF